MHFQQLRIYKIVYGILDFNKLLGTKSKNKYLINFNCIKGNNKPERDCPNSDLLLHYQYFNSNRNVLCEYVHDASPSMNEPQTTEFDLFNTNFCPYCIDEFWLNNGGNA
jgi:hypothetical protein